jgi:hypothetical protein
MDAQAFVKRIGDRVMVVRDVLIQAHSLTTFLFSSDGYFFSLSRLLCRWTGTGLNLSWAGVGGVVGF